MLADRLFDILPVAIRSALTEAYFAYSRPKRAALFSQFVQEGDLVFDIGANIGRMTRVFLGLGARVIAVDPQPYCLSMLERKFSGTDRVVIVPKGVGSASGSKTFHVSTRNHPTSTFSAEFIRQSRYSHRKWDNEISVDIVTLETLIRDFGRPAFIKIDTEGYEPQVIKGLRSKVPFLSFEFSGEFLDDAHQCIKHLDSLGNAEFNYSRHERLALASPQWGDARWLASALASSRKRYLGGDIFCRMR